MKPFPIPAVGTIISDPVEVNERLVEIGIPQYPLWMGLHSGLRYKASLTAHDTNAIRGIGVWNAILRGLADASVRHDWTKREYNNFAEIARDGLGIAVLGGDSNTGKAESVAGPHNAWPFEDGQRKLTNKRISRNLLLLRHRHHFSSVSASWDRPPLTYFLVHYIDVDEGEVWGELSLPTHVADGYITEWYERIILTPPTDLSAATPVAVESDPEDEGEPIVVPIVEKAV